MTKSDLEISRFEMRDLNRVRKIEAVSFPFPLSKFALVFLSEICIFYVATIREEVVGYIMLGYEDKETLHCFRIAVAPTHKRRRVASSLLRRGILENPCRCYTTEVRKDNIEGMKFWESQGFKEAPKDPKKLNIKKESLILVKQEKGIV